MKRGGLLEWLKRSGEKHPSSALYERNSVNCISLSFRSEQENSNAGDTPYHFLFGAVTKCLSYEKEESYLYKGFYLVWLESQEGINKLRSVKRICEGRFCTGCILRNLRSEQNIVVSLPD